MSKRTSVSRNDARPSADKEKPSSGETHFGKVYDATVIAYGENDIAAVRLVDPYTSRENKVTTRIVGAYIHYGANKPSIGSIISLTQTELEGLVQKFKIGQKSIPKEPPREYIETTIIQEPTPDNLNQQ